MIERCDDGASATLLAEEEELGASLNGLTLYAEDLMTFDALMPATDAASELAIARRVWPRMYSAQR